MLRLRREAREVLAERPTFEQIEREARTHRLKILPERQKRTQQGLLLDEVNFDDFDLGKYDKKTIIMNDNPDKGTQTDVFNETPSITESESIKSPEEEIKQLQTDESEETIKSSEKQQERERERTQKKSVIRRVYDAMFGDDGDDVTSPSRRSLDEFKEERDEMRSMREQIDTDDDLQREPSIEKQQSEQSDNSLPVNVKKSYEPSSSSSSSRRSSNRSVLLPVEEEALSEHIHSSPPVSVQSSVPSDRTIEYVDEESPPQSVVSSRRSQETIEYIRSRSSRRTISS